MKNRHRQFLKLLVATATVSISCRDDASCLRHTDCAREQSCLNGACVMDSTVPRELADAGQSGDEPGTPTSGGSGMLSAPSGDLAGGGSSAGGTISSSAGDSAGASEAGGTGGAGESSARSSGLAGEAAADD